MVSIWVFTDRGTIKSTASVDSFAIAGAFSVCHEVALPRNVTFLTVYFVILVHIVFFYFRTEYEIFRAV